MITVESDKRVSRVGIISVLHAAQFIRKNVSCLSCLCYDRWRKNHLLKLFPVNLIFPDVFPDDLLGIPPNSEVEFTADFTLEIMLIAKAPYRLALTEMKELKN